MGVAAPKPAFERKPGSSDPDELAAGQQLAPASGYQPFIPDYDFS